MGHSLSHRGAGAGGIFGAQKLPIIYHNSVGAHCGIPRWNLMDNIMGKPTRGE